MQFHAARNQAMQFCAARNQTNQWRHRNETVTQLFQESTQNASTLASCSIRVAPFGDWEIWFQITLTGPKIFVWPVGYFLAIFQDRLAPCKNQIWPPWVLSEKPYVFTFLTNWLQIFTKFLYFEGFRLQNFVRILRFSELI